jgi:hypothetical protein
VLAVGFGCGWNRDATPCAGCASARGVPWRAQSIIRTRHHDMLCMIKLAGVNDQLPKLNKVEKGR